MAPSRHDIVEEALSVIARDQDPQLQALQVALHLEDALDIEIPPRFLSAEHLASREAIVETLTAIERQL